MPQIPGFFLVSGTLDCGYVFRIPALDYAFLMMRSVFFAAVMVCLAAFSASAQMPNYWEATPPSIMRAPLTPPSAPELPEVPFAATRGVQVEATVTVDKNYKITGPWPPIWLGPREVALVVMHRNQITLVAFYGEHFTRTRVLADASTVNGGKILDMAVSRDGKRVAVAAVSDNKLQIWTRDTRGDTPASVTATIDQACDKAGIAWLDPDTLAIGAQCEAKPVLPSPLNLPTAGQPANPAQPGHRLLLVQVGAQQEPANLDLDCLDQIDPTSLSWSPDGGYAVAQKVEERNWVLIDRAKARCQQVKLAGVLPLNLIEWEKGEHRFLFTAAPARAPDPAHIGVMEYTVASQTARLLGSPAVSAVYLAGGGVAIMGSHRLTAAVMMSNPNLLVPAEVAWVDPLRSQLSIIQTGFSTTAAELLSATLRYSPARQLLATSFQTPGHKSPFTVLLWLSAVSKSRGVLGTGRVGHRMLSSWSPDGTSLAVLAGLPERPTLAIVAAPQ